MILYRPVGFQELGLIYDSGMKSFPARLPQQPIFYPVLDLDYARQTASSWNTQNKGYAGYVTQFKVEEEYISRFETHTVGDSQYQEFWIPAGEIEEFNRHILGHIKVVEAHFGDGFQGFIPEQFGLQRKNAVEQFTLLSNSYLYKRMDFYLEIKRNHKAVFLNYPFWQKYEFKNPGLKEKVLQAIKEAWLASFPLIPLPLPPPVKEDSPPGKPVNSIIDLDDEEVMLVEESDSDSSEELDEEEIAPVERGYPDAVEEDTPPVKPIHLLEQSVDEELLSEEKTDADAEVHSVQEEPPSVKPAHTLRAVHSIGKDIEPPEQIDPRLAQGTKLGLDGKYHEAIAELSRVVEEHPKHVVAQTSLGVAFHRLEEDDQALACYETALKIDPIYAEAHYFRANILYRRGQVQEAIAGYTVGIGLKPELIEAHQQPLPEDRLTDYSSSPAEIPRIAKPAHRILALNRSLETHPGQARLWKERAAEYYRLRNYAQAITDYSRALAFEPQDADALHLRGVAYEQLGQRDRAREEYRKALAINPQLPAIYIQRGVTHGNSGNLRQSITSFTEAIRLTPQNPDGYFNRGTAYFQQGNFEQAIADFSAVIQLAPNDEDAYYWRAVSHENAGHRQDATADYRRFLTLTQDARLRKEIEEKLSQWDAARRGATPENRQPQAEKREPALDLHGLLTALGERALRSTWFGRDVECYGEKAEELHAFTDHDRPIPGRGLLALASGIQQTRRGDFQAFDPGGESPWVFLRAWEGSGFYAETNDAGVKKQLRDHFPRAEEVDGASPGYEGMFIRISSE